MSQENDNSWNILVIIVRIPFTAILSILLLVEYILTLLIGVIYSIYSLLLHILKVFSYPFLLIYSILSNDKYLLSEYHKVITIKYLKKELSREFFSFFEEYEVNDVKIFLQDWIVAQRDFVDYLTNLSMAIRNLACVIGVLFGYTVALIIIISILMFAFSLII